MLKKYPYKTLSHFEEACDVTEYFMSGRVEIQALQENLSTSKIDSADKTLGAKRKCNNAAPVLKIICGTCKVQQISQQTYLCVK